MGEEGLSELLLCSINLSKKFFCGIIAADYSYQSQKDAGGGGGGNPPWACFISSDCGFVSHHDTSPLSPAWGGGDARG